MSRELNWEQYMSELTTDYKPSPGEHAKEAIGCGCAILLLGVLGPIICNAIGLSPWPPAIGFAIFAAAIFYRKHSPTRTIGWKAYLFYCLTGLVVACVFGLRLEQDSREAAVQPRINTSPAPRPSPELSPVEHDASSTDIPSGKDVIRLEIDEILSKFAKNQIGAAQFFETHIALIPGRAVRVREALGTGILVVKAAKTGTIIELGFSESGTQKLGPIEPGDYIEATCPKIVEWMSHISIVCTDVRKVAVTKP